VAEISPTMRQRELGKRLRELRGQHGLTIEEVAGILLCSATKISRLEAGARRPSLRDVRDLCALYGLNEATSAFYVPALLQTAEYTQAIIKAIAPKMSLDILQQRVEARMRRQQLLEGANRPRYRILLDESALYGRVGEASTMAAQLNKVLDAIHQDRAAVQIIRFDAGAHASADGYFVLLEFDEPRLSPVVFLEGRKYSEVVWLWFPRGKWRLPGLPGVVVLTALTAATRGFLDVG
jgi:transcriptional regulator with XRE-family HTH domain